MKVETIDLNEIKADKRMEQGFFAVQFTDQYRIGKWNASVEFEKTELEKLLELRIFNEECEYKWMRGNIGDSFYYRVLCDDADKYDYIEECQLLNINMKETTLTPGEVKTPNGGSFYLPIQVDLQKNNPDEPCLKIKYYIPKYDTNDPTTIHAHVEDWRMVGFCIKQKNK